MSDTNNYDSFEEVRIKLSVYLNICPCQRKLRSIVDQLYNIKRNIYRLNPINSEDVLLCAILDKLNILEHGINCEYPILTNMEFWKFIDKCYSNPNVINN